MLFYNVYGDCTGHYKHSGARIAVDVGTFAACAGIGLLVTAGGPAVALMFIVGIAATVVKDKCLDDKNDE